MKKIVVFGATGNIGAYLVDYLADKIDRSKFEIIAVGRKETKFFDRYGIEYISLDVEREADFQKLPRDDVYAVVNLVGILPAYLNENAPFRYIDVNIIGAVRILEYARACRADRCLYTQTWADQAGYWGKRKILSPDLPRKLVFTGDHAFYAITKCMVVDAMKFYKEEYGVKDFIFRLPNVYLYHPRKTYFVNGVEKKIAYRYMIDCAQTGRDLELWGDPSAYKDILYVKDLCKMMYLSILTSVDGGTYNAGTGRKTTLLKQIQGIKKVFGTPKTKIIYRPEKESFTSFVMDISNARADLGYEPEYAYLQYLKDYKIEKDSERFIELWS